jgi:CxxC-x17-CxxC domain-containing protein
MAYFRRGGFRRDFGPREMTKIKCAECGKEDEVPFKPREGSAVLCKECFMKKKGIRPSEKKEETEEPEEAEEVEEESEETEG